jgi:hypothetical protein
MQGIGKILLSGLVGALVCGLLGCAIFVLLAVGDGGRFVEALAYGLIVGFLAAAVGLPIGLVVGFGNFGALVGGLVGLLATLGLVLLYVVAISRPGEYAYFLGESRIILVVLTIPTVSSGVAAALFNRALT